MDAKQGAKDQLNDYKEQARSNILYHCEVAANTMRDASDNSGSKSPEQAIARCLSKAVGGGKAPAVLQSLRDSGVCK